MLAALAQLFNFFLLKKINIKFKGGFLPPSQKKRKKIIYQFI